MTSGRLLPNELQRASRACEACIFIATPASVDSRWCHAEVGAFWGRRKRVYIFTPDPSLDDQRLPPHLHDIIRKADRTDLVLQIKKDLWRARVMRWAAIFAAFTVVAVTLLLWLMFKNLSIPTISLRAESPEGIAEFGKMSPHNNLGREFHGFNDVKEFLKSGLSYEMKRHARSGRPYMSIHFKLDNSNLAYCGVYTEFSFPPAAVLDLSAFDGITFLARHKAENSKDDSWVEFALQVAIYGITEDHYHEAVFPLNPNAADFELITIRFSDLSIPRLGPWHQFSKAKVFRIALIIRGKSSEGQLEFYDMRGMRKGKSP